MNIVSKVKLFSFGLLFGIIIRLFDIYTQVLGNIFSSISVFILIGVLLVLKSKTRKDAMLNVFLFFIAMLITYYLTAMITHGVYGKRFIIGWGIVAFLSPILAYFTYFIKNNRTISKIIKIGIILLTIIVSIKLFDKLYFYDYLVLIALIYLMYIKKDK